jgi:hypothetical protein
MPLPIPILGKTELDPTLPNIIKPPLYVADEYQTSDLFIYDLGVFCSNHRLRLEKADYGVVGTLDPFFKHISGLEYTSANGVAEIITEFWYEKFIDVPYGWYDDQADLDSQRIFHNGIEYSYRYFLQRPLFKWASPPAPNLVGEYFPLFETNYRIIEKGVIDQNNQDWNQSLYGIEIKASDDPTINRIYAFNPISNFAFSIQRFSVWSYPWAEQYIQKLWNFSQYSILRFYFNGIKVKNKKITSNFEPNLIDKISIDKHPGIYIYGLIDTVNKKIEFTSDFNCTLIITYLYQDSSAVASVASFSKGYRQIDVIKGLNTFSFDAQGKSYWIRPPVCLPCSFVVSSYPSNSGAEGRFKDGLKVAFPKGDVLYEDFESYGEKISLNNSTGYKALYNDLDKMRTIEKYDISKFSHLFFATNNYWNNGNYYSDINPVMGVGRKHNTAFLNYSVNEIDEIRYKKNKNGEFEYSMPDSVRIQEIHAALEAQKFANDTKNNNQRVANLGYYIERIARVLGINVNENGTTKSIRQSRRIKPGETIAAGYEFGQFGLNAVGDKNGQFGGNPGELRDGIIYEQRSNKLIPDPFDPEKSKIEIGDYVLCENIPQLMTQILDDLDKALSWQEIGAGAIPSADGSKNVMLYEGLGSIVAESAYMLSKLSGLAAQNLVSSKVTQGITQEILAGLGVPIGDKVFYESLDRTKDPVAIHYPALLEEGITVTQQLGWILQNVGILVAGSVVYDESKPR